MAIKPVLAYSSCIFGIAGFGEIRENRCIKREVALDF